jgi:hypothetical protein
MLYLFLIAFMRSAWPPHLILLVLITLIIFGEDHKLCSSLCNFLRRHVASFLFVPNIFWTPYFMWYIGNHRCGRRGNQLRSVSAPICFSYPIVTLTNSHVIESFPLLAPRDVEPAYWRTRSVTSITLLSPPLVIIPVIKLSSGNVCRDCVETIKAMQKNSCTPVRSSAFGNCWKCIQTLWKEGTQQYVRWLTSFYTRIQTATTTTTTARSTEIHHRLGIRKTIGGSLRQDTGNRNAVSLYIFFMFVYALFIN